MNKGNSHINENDFRRYLDNKMTEAERNQFERKMQKNPFEAEAVEGFQNSSSDNLEKDITEIKNRLKNTKRFSVIRYWAAAASVLLLVITGLLWYQLREEPLPDMVQLEIKQQEKIPLAADSVSENLISTQESVRKESEKTQEEPETDSEEKSAVSEAADQAAPEIQNPQVTETQERLLSEEAPSKNKNQNYNARLAKASKAAAAKQDTKSVSINMISGQFSAPAPAGLKSVAQAKPETVAITERVAFPIDSNDVFPDSFKTISAEERERIQEIQGVAIQDQVELEADPYLTDVEVRPEGGMKNYMNYIEKQAVLPEDYPQMRETVKLVLNIDSRGKIVNIVSNNETDSLLFARSKRIIQNGPGWNPKIVNGKPVQSEVQLKIIFNKK